jgi:signal transduction histidine kinase
LLLLNQQGEWLIEAKIKMLFHESRQLFTEQIAVLQSEPLAEEKIPVRLIHYVARTKESIVLSDIANDSRFMQDHYITENKPKSILCMPLINQTYITGVLYLENNLMTGAFTPDRLEMLNLLSAQIAISIENARLYASLEEKVIARTQDIETKNRELVQLNTELVKLNQDKNEFLGIAAHDLKNPLLAIQGSAELIRIAFDDFSKEEIMEFASMIEISSQRMFELIKNLLDVNAIESEKMNLCLRQVNLLPILQSLVESYAQRALEKKITLKLSFFEESCFGYVDENITRQIFDNLISNAVKYSPFNQAVTIHLSQDEQFVYCAIQDNGPGLSRADQEKLFGKFVRLTPQPTGNEHSTGLGLFIVKKLVEAMNGRVKCESELGYGSTFTVEFPRLSLGEH